MTPVLAQMNRDGIRAAKLGKRGRPNGVRFRRLAGLANRGHMVDVHAENRQVSTSLACSLIIAESSAAKTHKET